MQSSNSRAPAFFWHNLGPRTSGSEPPSKTNSLGIPAEPQNAWWRHLVAKGQISANWRSAPDKAEKCLRSYVRGDTVIAYASGYGAVGWGVVESPKYIRLAKGDPEDVYPRQGLHLHRLKGVSWKQHTGILENALPPEEIRQIGPQVPLQTRERISNSGQARRLIERLKQRFGTNPQAANFFVDDPMIAQERGAGFQSNVKIRIAIEKYAMEKARKALESKGYGNFEDTALRECYDYTCQKHRSIHYVEVKGTQTDGASIILTRNEVEHARRHPDDSILVIVHSIEVTGERNLRLKNGKVLVKEKWEIASGDLTPIQYFWAVS